MSKRSNVHMIGVPDHQGVIHIGGRIGAADGPRFFRKAFERLNFQSPHLQVRDCGDVPGLGSDIEQNHKLARNFIAQNHPEKGVSIVVGGSHDHGFTHLAGIQDALRERKTPFQLGCINIDAHLDVRKPEPKIMSGSPFFLALESRVLEAQNFVEFGIQDHCNRPELFEYVRKKNVKVIAYTELRKNAVATFEATVKKLSTQCDALVISLDLDAVTEASAPGTSAPQAEGFTASETIQMAEIAGNISNVVSLGIFELNPFHDVDQKTARLAATVAHHFASTWFKAATLS